MQKRIITHIGVTYFIFAAITILMQQMLSYYFSNNPTPLLNNIWFVWILSSLPMYCIAFPLAYAKIRQIPRVYVNKEEMKPVRFFMFLCAAIFILYAGNIISMALCRAVTAMTGLDTTFTLGEVLSQSGWLPSLVFSVIFAPLFEELIFRKMLVDRAIVLGDGTAIVLSGVIFGLFHGNLNQFIYAAGLGCLLAYVYIRTGDIKIPVFIHMIINFIGGVLPTILMQLMSDELINSGNFAFSKEMFSYLGTQDLVAIIGYNIYMYLVMFMGGAGLLFLLKGRHEMILKPGEYSREMGETAKDMFLNPGMLLFIVICLYLFADSLGIGI